MRSRKGRNTLGTLLIIGLVVVVAVKMAPQQKTGPILPSPYPTPQPGIVPPVTLSWYEYTTDAHTLQNQGCYAARGIVPQPNTRNYPHQGATIQNIATRGLIVLDWGQVDNSLGTPGTFDFGGQIVTDDQIAQAVENFIQGVWKCRTASTNFAIAIGLSNWGPCYCYPSGATPEEQNAGWYKSGQAWGQMVNRVEKYIQDNGMSGQLVADAADDLEEDQNVYPKDPDPNAHWGTAAHSVAFIDGYNQATNQLLFDFGDDEWILDYPTPGHGDWVHQNLWYVAYGAKDDLPLPEIYWSGTDTAWEDLSKWACKNKGEPIRIIGVITEYPDGGWGPAYAWSRMYNAIVSDSCTAKMASSLLLATNINWAQHFLWPDILGS